MASSSSPSSSLPSNIIFEILTRTSLKTLYTCKAVSKEWQDLIHESSFMPQFCARSQNISGYFVQTLAWANYVTEFVSMDGCSGNNSTNKAPFHLPIDDSIVKPPNNRRDPYFDMKIEASSKQGILCCVRQSKNEYRYHICKPSTKQWIKLPNPRMRYSTIKVALVVLRSDPLHFKIIRLSSPRTTYPYHHYRNQGLDYYRAEIFDSEGWEWRQGRELLVPPGLYVDMFAPAIYASGLVYFKLGNNQVMALNYNGEEAFPRFSLPNLAFEYEDYPYNQLLEYNGKLGFTCLSPKGMTLWVYDNRRQVWELKKEVDTKTVNRVIKFPSPVGFYNADIAIMKDYRELIFYKLQDKSLNVVKLKKCPTIREIFPFRSDLEPINLRMRGAHH